MEQMICYFKYFKSVRGAKTPLTKKATRCITLITAQREAGNVDGWAHLSFIVRTAERSRIILKKDVTVFQSGPWELVLTAARVARTVPLVSRSPRCREERTGAARLTFQKPNRFRSTPPLIALYLSSFSLVGVDPEQEARFLNTFPPTWVTEGDDLTLQCSFTPALPQEVSWFRDGERLKKLRHRCDQSTHELCHCLYLGVQLHPSSTVEVNTADHVTSITLRAAHKEHEGFYSVRLKTWNEVEHSAYVYVRGRSEALNRCTPLACY